MRTFIQSSGPHPLFHPKRLYLETKAYQALHEKLNQWLWCGEPGGFIEGYPRRGKTFASRMMIHNLETRSEEELPVFRMAMHRRDQKTIRMVFYRLAKSMKLEFSEKATCDRISTQVKEHMSDYAMSNDENRVVLIVDESQRLDAEQIEAFSEIYDDLEENDITASIFFIANSAESAKLIDEIEDGTHGAVRGRFFTQRYHFKGFCSLSDIEFTLKQYDTVRYPPENGPTLTEYILPEEFKSGFRYAQLSQPIWQCFEENFKRHLRLRDWPAQHFFSTATRLLIDFLYQYGVDKLSDDVIRNYIDTSGLVRDQVRQDEN